MNTYKKIDYFTTGLAIFAMFFGAGNIIFPLALGQHALNYTPWALAGLLLTAVAIPFAGLLAMCRYGGEIRQFFSRLGKVPGLMIASLTIALLGPLGAAPRCIVLAHSTFSVSFPGMPLVLFSGVACLVIFCFTYRENQLLKILGYVLSPLKISLLIWILIKGFMEAPESSLISSNGSQISHFFHGVTEGYNTMDLLASFFFAPIVIASLKPSSNSKEFNRFIIGACSIGAFLLAFIYTGFCYLSYFYALELNAVLPSQLLAVIAQKVLGKHAGLIVSLTVTIACLTTAIALIAAFVSFISKEIFQKRVHHFNLSSVSLLITFAVTALEFQRIAYFLNPILEVCYPCLILLTFYNLLFPQKERSFP